jgi:hypothetical protein
MKNAKREFDALDHTLISVIQLVCLSMAIRANC